MGKANFLWLKKTHVKHRQQGFPTRLIQRGVMVFSTWDQFRPEKKSKILAEAVCNYSGFAGTGGRQLPMRHQVGESVPVSQFLGGEANFRRVGGSAEPPLPQLGMKPNKQASWGPNSGDHDNNGGGGEQGAERDVVTAHAPQVALALRGEVTREPERCPPPGKLSQKKVLSDRRGTAEIRIVSMCVSPSTHTFRVPA